MGNSHLSAGVLLKSSNGHENNTMKEKTKHLLLDGDELTPMEKYLIEKQNTLCIIIIITDTQRIFHL